MTHAEFTDLVAQLPDLGRHLASLKAAHSAARSDTRFAKVETDVETWRGQQISSKRRFTKAELAEVRGQIEDEHADERRHTAADLKTALGVAQEQLSSVKNHAEKLRPEWQRMADRDQDYPRAMLRLGDDVAAQSIRTRLTGGTWRDVESAYADAGEIGDAVTLRVIENERDQLRLSQPTSDDVVALFRLVGTIREARASRRPAEALSLQPLVDDLTKTLRTDELTTTFIPALVERVA